MKIGIVTFHSAHNYGAVLQAWSLQEYLKQQGHQVEIVNLRLTVIDKLYRLTYKTNRKVCKSAIINRLANNMYFKLRCASYRFKDAPKYEKYHKFEHFINHILPTTEEFKSYKALCEANLEYDALIVGSDQVWNATMMKGIDPAYFLQFSGDNALRISYAASIGTDEIPEKFQLLFKRYLREFDAISVREKKAQEAIEQLTDKKVEVVADPTFLLTEKDFSILKKRSHIKEKYIYVHNVHLKRRDESLNSVVEELSKRLNLPVVHNWSEKVFSNEAGHFTGGIDEFLGVVSEAEYVVTNSFHCTAFAITYHKDFITVPHFKNPDRMKHLLGELGLSNHLIDDGEKIPKDLKELSINYDVVEANKTIMREQARGFLKRALDSSKEKDDRTYFDYEDEFRCYGCGACKDICPVSAITMEEDKEGFEYPVINEQLCIHCDKCKRTCIYHQQESKNEKQGELPIVYAAYSKDEDVLKKSTSGGMFTPMYRNILEKGGKVVGVRYDKDMNVLYDIAGEEKECEQFRGSKYIQANSMDVKPKVKQLLEEGGDVLFSGTPCQIAGLKSYLQKDYPKLYTVELICHSAGSPKVFKKYIEYLEELYKSKIIEFDFRNKFKGIDKPFVLVEFESGSIDIELAVKNNLSRAFRSNNMQRPSCYTCEFAGLKSGVADFTIGDYWGIKKEHPEFYNEKGVSILKINTIKGAKFFDEIKEKYVFLPTTYEKAYAANHVKPTLMKGGRSRLMYYIDEKPIDDLLLTFNHKKKGGIKGL